MKPSFLAKNKTKMALATMIANFVIAIISIYAVDMPDETKVHLIEVVMWIIGIIGGGYIGVEGYIDQAAAKPSAMVTLSPPPADLDSIKSQMETIIAQILAAQQQDK